VIKSLRSIPQRLAVGISFLVTGAILASCSSVSSASTAFTVNGATYSKDNFNKVANLLVDAGQFTKVNGEVKTSDAKVVMKELIRYEAYKKFISQQKIVETAADIKTVRDSASGDETFAKLVPELQDLLVDLNVAGIVLKKIAAPTESAINKLYTSAPASAGVLCLSHILVKTEAEAKVVLSDLKKGTPFAVVAAKKSIEPGADKSGGALSNGDQACQLLTDLQKSFDKDFMVGAVAAKPGIPTGPIKSQFGYHIILSHNFADVKASAISLVGQNPGEILLAGFMTQADITVNSIYGTWNSATATVL